MQWELSPGTSLGPHLRLGHTSLRAALRVVRAAEAELDAEPPDGGGGGGGGDSSAATKNRIRFSAMTPAEHDVVVDSPSLGMRLRFAGSTQRLFCVDVFDLSRIPLSFGKVVFGGVRVETATMLRLYELFGPTVRGRQISPREYALQYPGFFVVFEVNGESHGGGSGGGVGGEDDDDALLLPLELPDGTSPRAIRLVVHPATTSQFWGGVIRPSPNTTAASQSPVMVKLSSSSPSVVMVASGSAQLILGVTSFQDVLGELGTPSRTHTSTSAATVATFSPQDYFLNYFDLGMDVLMDGKTHRVKSVVLRTNTPGHMCFDEYEKCMFGVEVVPTTTVISCDDKWDVVSPLFTVLPPLVYDLGSTLNPFGPTLLYETGEGLLFEVVKGSGVVASLTVSVR